MKRDGTDQPFKEREPETGPRIMTLGRQRLAIGYVEAVVDAIERNALTADVLESLRRSGRYILHAPETHTLDRSGS